VDAGRGDVPLIEWRWRCANCRSRLTDFVCTSQDAVRVPWRASETRPGPRGFLLVERLVSDL
jgi:hypothetical protein